MPVVRLWGMQSPVWDHPRGPSGCLRSNTFCEAWKCVSVVSGSGFREGWAHSGFIQVSLRIGYFAARNEPDVLSLSSRFQQKTST